MFECPANKVTFAAERIHWHINKTQNAKIHTNFSFRSKYSGCECNAAQKNRHMKAHSCAKQIVYASRTQIRQTWTNKRGNFLQLPVKIFVARKNPGGTEMHESFAQLSPHSEILIWCKMGKKKHNSFNLKNKMKQINGYYFIKIRQLKQ